MMVRRYWTGWVVNLITKAVLIGIMAIEAPRRAEGQRQERIGRRVIDIKPRAGRP